MADLTTTFMGLKLKNPLIIGSCGLTDSVEEIKRLEENGAAAVVLKSIFEEEILMEAEHHIYSAQKAGYDPKAFDYYDYKIKDQALTDYIQLIKDVKQAVNIPIIASINCVSGHEWPYYAQRFEEAGADALELNIFVLPTNMNRTAEQNEQVYFDVAEKVKKEVSIPVSLKISYYSAALAPFISRLSRTGIDGLVMFNRFWSPDFDIEKFTVVSSHVLSKPEELSLSLRWISVMADRVECDLAASTGIHDGSAVIKQLLAGAKAVQVVSALYREGKGLLNEMLIDLNNWMERHEFEHIDQFRGRMSQSKSDDPAMYERVQFMRYFRGHEMP